MIQINAALTTPDGGTIASGSVIDITAHFKSKVVDVVDENDIVTGQTAEHYVAYDIDLYRSMAAYEAKTPPVKSVFDEFNVGYTEMGIDIAALDASAGAMATVTAWLQSHIEDGDSSYPGVGTGNTAIVYPTFA